MNGQMGKGRIRDRLALLSIPNHLLSFEERALSGLDEIVAGLHCPAPASGSEVLLGPGKVTVSDGGRNSRVGNVNGFLLGLVEGGAKVRQLLVRPCKFGLHFWGNGRVKCVQCEGRVRQMHVCGVE